VSVEAEIKAKVRGPERLQAALAGRATGEKSVYADRYFDRPDRQWTRDGHELRVRTVTDEAGGTRTVLTFKEPVVDEATGSKPEHETTAADPDVLVTVLTALDAVEVIAFEKHCTNYRFTAHGRELLATVVTIPELADGETFLELETIAEPGELDAALAVVRAVLGELSIEPGDYTTELYADAVSLHRTRRPAGG
jgi:adenylate cyclase class 2